MNICKPAGILTTEWCDGTDGWGADVAKDLPPKVVIRCAMCFVRMN